VKMPNERVFGHEKS